MYKYRDKRHVKYDLCKLIDLIEKLVGDKHCGEPPIRLYYLRNLTFDNNDYNNYMKYF